jgi:hypothetical protein
MGQSRGKVDAADGALLPDLSITPRSIDTAPGHSHSSWSPPIRCMELYPTPQKICLPLGELESGSRRPRGRPVGGRTCRARYRRESLSGRPGRSASSRATPAASRPCRSAPGRSFEPQLSQIRFCHRHIRVPQGLLDLVDVVRCFIEPHHERVAQVVEGVPLLELRLHVELPDQVAEAVGDLRRRQCREGVARGQPGPR